MLAGGGIFEICRLHAIAIENCCQGDDRIDIGNNAIIARDKDIGIEGYEQEIEEAAHDRASVECCVGTEPLQFLTHAGCVLRRSVREKCRGPVLNG